MWFGSFMRRISTNHWCVSSCEQEVRPTYITGDDWLLSRCFFFCPLNTQEPDGALKQIAAEGPSGCVVFGAVQRLQLQQSFRCVCWRVGSLDLEQDQSSLRRQCSTHKNQSRLCSRKEMALTRTHAYAGSVCVFTCAGFSSSSSSIESLLVLWVNFSHRYSRSKAIVVKCIQQ